MLISVVVPVYNAEKFLKRSIESVINQNYKNIELLLVNDGSTDQSEVLCRQYALSDKRIRIISQKNSGPAAARNTGMENATGTFVFFLDADDFIAPETLEKLISYYNKYRPGMVMGNFCKLAGGGEITRQRVSFHPDNEPFTGNVMLLSGADITSYVRHFLRYPSNHLVSYCWGRLYKLSIIKDNGIRANEDMRLFEDFVFNLEYLKHTDEIAFVNEPIYTYAMHDSHVSASMAIVDGDSLLHDMNVFKTKAFEYLRQAKVDGLNESGIWKEIGHALVHYVIIFMIRSCRQITDDTRSKIYNEFSKLVNAPILKESLLCYTPTKGNTRVLPLLMRLKMVNLLMFIGRYKAYKRYGRPERD